MKEFILILLVLVVLQISSGQVRNTCKCFPGSKMFYEYATCQLAPNPGIETAINIRGVVRIRQRSCYWCKEAAEISVSITGLSRIEQTGPKKHGFHVHELGDISGGCGSAAGHYNPFNLNHGAPNGTVRHVGDLGNIVDKGTGTINEYFRDDVVSISGNIGVLGRSIVLHALEDDLGRGGDAGSLKTGNAGSRLACCVIGRATNSSWVQPTVPLSRRTALPARQFHCSWFFRQWFPESCMGGGVLVGDY